MREAKDCVIIITVMIRAHKIRIYPTPSQEQVLRQHVGGARFVYNWALERWKKWADDKKNGLCEDNPNWVKLSRIWTNERPEWATSVTRTAVTYAIKSVNVAYTNHFRNGAGWPKFKKRGVCRDSFHLGADKCSVRPDGFHIRIPLVKKDVKMSEAPRFKGKVLGYTISACGGRWYVSIQMDVEDGRVAPDSTCGVDVGMKSAAVCSDGTVCKLPAEKLKRLEKRLRRSQRRLSRAQKASRRRLKALRRKQRVQQRINDIRRDAINKFTSAVCKNHGTVVVEDLMLTGMHNGPKNIRSGMQRSCMMETLRQLGYKAINLMVADRWFPSSQLCSSCGHRQKLTLNQRVYRCPECGARIDRDLNAAINLSKYPGSLG